MGDWEDPRAEWISEWVLGTTKSKADKWKKLVSQDELKQVIMDFFEKKEIMRLVFAVDAKNALTPSYDFPASTKSKAIYFLKPEEMTVTKDNVKTLIRGDLSHDPVEQVSALVNGLFLPLLNSKANNEAWPTVVASDVVQQAQTLKNSAYVVNGQVKGKTLLPIPTGSDALLAGEESESTDEVLLIHVVESAVIEWSHQVRDVLKQDSAQPLIDGEHCTPFVELDFWVAREVNCKSISEQLHAPNVLKMKEILEKHQSSYAPAFEKLYADVAEAQREAEDINIHLSGVRRYLEDYEQAELAESQTVFDQIIHLVGLIWKSSKYYGTARHIVVLLRELLNQLIELTQNALEPQGLLRGEPEESLQKVQDARKIFAGARTTFEGVRAKINTEAKESESKPEGERTQPWEFETELVFGRLNGFGTRLVSLEQIISDAVQFFRLEKVEVSDGQLSHHIQDIFEEFKVVFEEMAKRLGEEGGYNCFDPEAKQFPGDYDYYMDKMAEFDRRLGAIACLAFDNASNLEACFKLITGFQGLLERPLIAECVADQYPRMITFYDDEIEQVKVIFDDQRSNPTISKNMPKTAGALEVSAKLRDRVLSTKQQLQGIDHPVFASPEAQETYDKADGLLKQFSEYDNERFEEWAKDVGDVSKGNLSRCLLVRNKENNTIAVNFDPQLVATLREVKYLQTLTQENGMAIPESASEIYSRNETFRQYLGNLDITVAEYNRIQSTVLDVELPLIEGELETIDKMLERGISDLNWDNSEVGEYCQKAKESVEELSNRLQKSKENLNSIVEIVEKWYSAPLVVRDVKSNLLIFEDRAKVMSGSVTNISSNSEQISTLLTDSKDNCFKTGDTDEYKAYVQYVDAIILDGLYNTVFGSMTYLLDNMGPNPDDPDAPVRPLMAGKMGLIDDRVQCTPGINESDPNPSLMDQLKTYMSDFFTCGTLIGRLDQGSGKPDYRSDLEEMEELKELHEEVEIKVGNVISEVEDNKQTLLSKYEYLWTDDRSAFMDEFLKYGRIRTAEEKEDTENPVPTAAPTLEAFKENIDKYNGIADQVTQESDNSVFCMWFKVDCRDFKSTLHNEVKKWSFMFIQHLQESTTEKLASLETFIEETEKGLERDMPEEGDEDAYNKLVKVMGYINAINNRAPETDAMFEPLNQTVTLLASYDVEMPPEIHQQLQVLPEKWSKLKKQGESAQSGVAPAQADEVVKLKRKANQFDVRNFEFREQFIKNAPLFFDSKHVYRRLDTHYQEYLVMEKEMNALYESAVLFNVTLPEYKQLKGCRTELGLLKTLWDMIYLCKSEFDSWKQTLWKEVNVEQMETDCKRMIKDLRKLDKETRAWEAFNGIDAQVKNMVTSLGAVGMLQSPAIRDRHWQQVMDTTGVRIEMKDDTSLADLLELNLHEFEDEVSGIVDKANKEQGMEKMLGELESTWSSMDVEYDEHPRTKVALIKVSEEVVETLEDNQVQLQNVLASKYIAFFLEEVSAWQKKLSTADQVFEIWLEVQRTWSHLESIFIGSEDIRAQLPEDSKRFDTIDVDFKEIMKNAKETPNAVEVTNTPNLYDKLEDIQKRLSLCEKALQEYLETKRLAFPRFYFVSSSDLLDILSNGTMPEKVAPQLAKLFQMMCNLKFSENVDKQAVGMYALDGEYVDFTEPVVLDGRVEDWLNRLLSNMIKTIRDLLTTSIVAYGEKKRSEWVFDYPAQVSLVGTQVWWATEVESAFGRLEEGYENAMKDYNKKQISHLNDLITLLQGKLTKAQRVMLQTICTVDVHSRDIVIGLVNSKAENAEAFMWISQLRHYWDDKENHCNIQICDARFRYSYEYLGNVPRLVITPLTDRCYITLTQSLHLIMSGAPAGPAGTGKTETTKDLGRNIGIMVYVFNCSEQMDYKSVGNIYKGLSQTGAWGCFDEFNRISVEVLSVVAVQVKMIQDAIRAKKKRFDFLGEEISLNPTVGIYITMNPGYAGRSELPENIKALFRPCAMVVPDYGQICEIMLVSEGFLNAKLLARKFITLYTLNRDLLSKQDHYDWGLRAIKSVLVVAGALKRADPDRIEDEVLMRALRDFNIPKIVNEDLPVFMGLIGDLFPGLTVPRKRDEKFEGEVRQAISELNLQAEDSFVLKVVQLQELLDVRHSVFVLGPEATGKSGVIKSLYKTYQVQKRKPVWADINPKAVTNHELYGYINLATRDWVDGLFSVIMRDMSNIENNAPKWIVLDGDIDAMWIESLNTVMDDNKVLTLASNERIALKPEMRLLFEIANLTYASPATVSRAGILFVNPTDLGWNPFVTSWLETLDSPSLKSNLMILFEKYVPSCLEVMKHRFKTITPISDWAWVNSLCKLIEVIMTPERLPEGSTKEDFELYFSWCVVWGFGGGLFKDQLVDWRDEFTKWWSVEFKTIKYPTSGSVFDYYIRDTDKKFAPWSELVPEFTYDPELPMAASLVPTAETARTRFWMDLLMDKLHHPCILVGAPGTGKTAIINDKLASLNQEDWMDQKTSFNNYTTHHAIQAILEAPLEKKAGRNYGPPGQKRLIYFVDDLNMPEVDLYGTASPHTIMRQVLDYNHWYDRQKKQLRVVSNVQFVCSMNPKAGSFTINPRLLRHFTVFAVSAPMSSALQTIYSSLLNGYLHSAGFPNSVLKISDKLVATAIKLHEKVTQAFLPTAIKFHYLFNLRDLSNIFQGMAFASSEVMKTPLQIVRLWMHEAERVYSDKFVDKEEVTQFLDFRKQILSGDFSDLESEKIDELPLTHCHFAFGLGEPKYGQVKDSTTLHTILVEALNNYNEVNAAMNLVLFEDAMQYVCRINRILESPRGNALLVGVGGSGKQSLSRLAASISGLDTFQIALSKGYGMNELKADLAACFVKAGQKGQGVMFLMTDAQVADEKWLVLINDLLSSGDIPNLFQLDEQNDIMDGVRGEVKGLGLEDNNTNCWNFFLDRVRRLLKVVLCFSPVGQTLRLRARKFPGLVNNTSIIWFHEWPQEALVSVSGNFLSENELIPDPLKSPISKFMAYVHTTVNDMSKTYLEMERRYNYTTPKSFLEQIALYQTLLTRKHGELQQAMDRMDNGLTKLKSTAAQVDDLQEKLKAQEIELAEKNKEADDLIEKVGKETAIVNKEKEGAAVEQEKVRVLNEEVGAKQRSCEEDLAKAEPALLAAQEALDTLNKNNLTELKSFGSPPDVVVTVAAAVMCLLAKGKVPKNRDWKAAKLMMGNVGDFLSQLVNYDKENIPAQNLKEVRFYLKDPDFNPDFVKGKSLAAGGLCSWVRNIVTFYDIYCDVEPKRIALAEANAQLDSAQKTLNKIMDKINKLDEALGKLTAEFTEATNAKLKCQQEADETSKVINLAHRLVGGLASEKVRWGETVERLKKEEKTLPGDVLLVTAFLSYTGCFSKQYREKLYTDLWIPFLNKEGAIPVTENLDPLRVLTDASTIAGWNNEGLPADRVSTENATILVSAARWPLIIDPQEQGIKWIKEREGEDLVVVRLGQKGYLDSIERAVGNGDCVLIENLGESVDPVLDNLLGRVTVKKGKFIMIGDKEVDYNPKFRLILHTKLGNPHYKPEMQAQCTLINFTVTQSGLEDQLLADVVTAERPDLQEQKAALTRQQNEFSITLKELEDALLARLSSAEGDFLKDEALVVGLENTKKTAGEIAIKAEDAKVTEKKINEARELYRPAAARSSLLYFIIDLLFKIHPMYQVSLKAFNVVFQRAISLAEKDEDVKTRVKHLIDQITFSVYVYTSRGLFERDKLIFASQMVFQIINMDGNLVPEELQFLLRLPSVPNSVSPVDFLTHSSWGSVKALSAMETFNGFDRDIEGSAKRWSKLCSAPNPENEKFPGDWKNKTPMQKMCMLRCLRPDRMLYAISTFVGEILGERFVSGLSTNFATSFEETSRSTGVFFILSQGVNPITQVEAHGEKIGFKVDNGNYHQVSLGQGQEIVAETTIDKAAKEGHWVILENIHLVRKWLAVLEKKIEECSDTAHEDFRFFLTAEPASHEYHIMPQGILQACIKITNEPPTGMQANLHAALDNFTQDTLEQCAKENEFRRIFFSIVYFHAVVIERRKFGPMGWNVVYPFNPGDLRISVNVLLSYLESNPTVPWTDLRYLFGEIMYGGHITDNLDRRLCNTYLLEFMRPEMLDADIDLATDFTAPAPMDFDDYHAFIDENLPKESPLLYGMHPNAEIDFLTTTSGHLFQTVLEMQPRTSGGSGSGGMSRDEQIKQTLEEIIEKLPEEFNMVELNAKVPAEERTPYMVVAFQECARMNKLTFEIRRSLKELGLGLKGELTISAAMEDLAESVFLNRVPGSWEPLAYPSTKALSDWYLDLLERIKFLEAWSTDFSLPNSVWLGGLFNPQSFLTAIMQQTARKNEWPLDKMCLTCDVTKKFNASDFPQPPREGSYVHGLFMEGARWDTQTSQIQEARLKELTPNMPVLFIKAVPVDKREVRGMYECPTFKTKERGRAREQVAVGVCPGFVWSLFLKTKQHPHKWTLAGVAMLLSD